MLISLRVFFLSTGHASPLKRRTKMPCGRVLLLLISLALEAQSFVVLKDIAYKRLNDVDGNPSINASTHNSLAFDYETNILYVTAKEPHRLTAFSLDLNGTPTLLTEEVFHTTGFGLPLDVEFCRPSQSGVARLAISFENVPSPSAEGRVALFEALTPSQAELKLIKTIAVGAQPVDIEFMKECSEILVANRGRPSKEEDEYRDPEGTLTRIEMPPDFNEDSPVIITDITFHRMFTGPGFEEFLELLRESNFRHYPLRDPNDNILSVMQNLEPEDIVIAPNSFSAYVSLPKNNAVAKVNLETNQISTVIALGNRSWTDYYMDPSDADTEVLMRGYNIYSLKQPTEIAWLSKGGSDWLLMLDTGRLDDSPAYDYKDFERGRTLMESGDIATSDTNLQTQLFNDTELGRLYVSKEDGKRSSDGKIETVYTFGGRGFSIHNVNNFQQQSGVVDNIEQVTKQYYRSVFNTAYQDPMGTPITDAEATSPSLGPNLGAVAVGQFGNKTLLFFGSATSGILYVYQMVPDAECPQATFHSLHRSGSVDSTWDMAFDQEQMGDIGINDMMYLEDTDLHPVLVVASSTSNSISVYAVSDDKFTLQPVRR